MSISTYIKEIGRGKKGARSLGREQAADLFTQVLSGAVTDLEIGAFCLAMRIKGETPEEMAGFLDATRASSTLVHSAPGAHPVVVVPSYNGARKLPALTPLLALLLADKGLPVLVHGAASESTRTHIKNTPFRHGITAFSATESLVNGQIYFADTAQLNPGLDKLLQVRRVIGLRNSAHSVVKLMNPCEHASVVVASYTHPEYAISMAQTFCLVQATAMLLRGTEGESVADPRRIPPMQGFVQGVQQTLEVTQPGPLPTTADLPESADTESTARYIERVMAGELAVPVSLARQVEHILRLCGLTPELSPEQALLA
jgi:anthranilate phosphoribosyltransferase